MLRGSSTGTRSGAAPPPPPPPPPTGGVAYTVNPKGLATTVYVDYGTDFKTFASSTAGVAIGSGSTDVTGSISMEGLLSANTVYFYRVRATNSQGASVSDTEWLVTAAASGTTRHVGASQPYSTITAALAASSGGDTIVVHAGSYARVTVSQAFSSLVNIVRSGSDVVTIRGVAHSGASNVRWGPGFTFDGTDGNSRIVDVSASSNIYFDSLTITSPPVNVGTMFGLLIGKNSSWVYLLDCVVYGGGNNKGYDGNPLSPGTWPAHCRFLRTEMYGSQGDILHMDGFSDWVFEQAWHHDPTPVTVPAGPNDEHHDGIQGVYGDDLTIRRSKFSCASGVDNSQGMAVILGYDPLRTPSVTSVVAQSNLFTGWWGPGWISQGAAVVMRNCTFYGNSGVSSPPSNQVNEDFIYGSSGDSLDVKNTLFVKPYTNGGASAPTGSHNHITNPSSQTAFKTNFTNLTTGTPEFVAAGTDFRPAVGGNLDGTGTDDASVLDWDYSGRGWGASVARGCYASSAVTTPVVGATGFTP